MEKLKFSYNGFTVFFVGIIFLILIIYGPLLFNLSLLFIYLILLKNSLKSIVFEENRVIVARHFFFWLSPLEFKYTEIFKVTMCSSNRLFAPVFSIYTNKGRHQFFLPKEEKKKLITLLHEKKYFKSNESDASNEIFKQAIKKR